MSRKPKILMLYTGGTIGMILQENGSYFPFSLENLLAQIPEIAKFDCSIDTDSFDEPIDSSNMLPEHWQRIALRIKEDYGQYDAFLILHGSDTMAYTSSALSFMLDNLSKPVILTGSQLPIGIPRSDARENILSSIEIALARNDEGGPLVPEVAVYFEYDLYRGNRVQKVSAEDFEAFQSPNYPKLAEAGVSIKYNRNYIARAKAGALQVNLDLEARIGIIHCFPGMSAELILPQILNSQTQAFILRSFGAGNAPSLDWLIEALEKSCNSGIPVINLSQCSAGSIEMTKYEVGRRYHEIGVISAGDMTFEAALCKTMFLLGKDLKGEEFKEAFAQDLKGEVSF
jgi:L-asparaginase